MLLTGFLRANLEPIVIEFEAFARTMGPPAGRMTDLALRDHAADILLAIASDMETAQTEGQRQTKSQGRAPASAGRQTSAAAHGAMRQMVGFDLNQVSAEFRALRATVLRLWKDKVETVDGSVLEEMTRFNESMDQALSESIAAYSARTAESRDLFLAVLGHDLRSPLGSLAGCVQLLAKFDPSGEQKQKALAIANRSVATIDMMVTDLLEYTRDRLGKGIEVVPVMGDFGTLCEETLQEMRASYVNRELVFERSGNLEIEFDNSRMRQVLTNLLGNAVLHADPAQPIHFKVTGDEHLVQASVSNRGVPIPKATRDVIFNPLVQLARAKTHPDPRPTTSLGLGLFIAREIVRAHGAELGVTSSAEAGTVFTILMARERAAASHRGNA